MEARGTVIALTGVLMLGAVGVAAAAPGDTTLTGTTAEDTNVKLTVGPAGNATAFKIGKTEVDCAEGGELTNSGGTYTRFDTSDPGEFHDKRSATSSGGGYDFKTRSVIHGEIGADQESWSGTFKLITKVFDAGDRIDVCKLKTEWSVS